MSDIARSTKPPCRNAFNYFAILLNNFIKCLNILVKTFVAVLPIGLPKLTLRKLIIHVANSKGTIEKESVFRIGRRLHYRG
jgi:hypothetical protein